MRTLIKAGLLAAMLCTSAAWAQAPSAVGLWKTIDDETGKPKALVRITEENGALQGKITALATPSAYADFDIPVAKAACVVSGITEAGRIVSGLATSTSATLEAQADFVTAFTSGFPDS